MPFPAAQPARSDDAHLGAVLDELGDLRSPRFASLVQIAAHEWPATFVAEAAHFLAILHGELPSVVEYAADALEISPAWLEASASSFHSDRSWLTAVTVETGPRVELAGLTQAELAVRGLREAMLTLARSPRDGCALGVAAAFTIEWPIIAHALHDAGSRLFAPRWPERIPRWPDTTAQGARAEIMPRAESRPVCFGVVQYSALHAQLLDLLSARAKLPRS